MSVSFSIQSITETSVNIRVNPDSSYSAYRVFVRTESGTTVFDRWYSGISYQFDAYVSNLTAETDYVVNVAYNTSATATGSTWIGGQTFTTSAAVTYYYTTIAYNANGGSDAPGSQTFTGTSSSLTVTLSSVIPARSGYTFLGWSTDSSATTAQYYAETTYYNWYGTTSGNYTTILYAVWQKATYSVTVVYDANGGTGAPNSQTATGTSQYLSLTLSSTKPTRTGYTFIGWSTSQTATTATYLAGQTLSSVYATTSGNYWYLYAVWRHDTSGKIYVWYNGTWKLATPYVWYNGTWKLATPYVWYNGTWKVPS